MSLSKVALAAVLSALARADAPPRPTPATPGGQANRPPAVKFNSSTVRVVLADGCPEDARPIPACRATSRKVQLSAEGSDPDGDRLLYTYSTTVGTLSGDGPHTTLDLKGVAPGVYTVTVEVSDGRGGAASDTARIEVSRCVCDPVPTPPPPCPSVTVSCPDTGTVGSPVTFKAAVSAGDPNVTPTFKWDVPGFRILSGQGTAAIKVDPPA